MPVSKIGVNALSTGGPYWDSAGNVGIGTSSPTSKLNIFNSTAPETRLQANLSATGTFVEMGRVSFGRAGVTPTAYIAGLTSDWGGTYSNGVLDFYTGTATTPGALAARIDTSGNLLVNTTSNNGFSATRLQVLAPGGGAGGLVRVTNNGDWAWFFLNNSGSVVGNISAGASSTAYNTTSDYRLKENVQPLQNALARIAALKPCTYTWKESGDSGEGFIAHELAEVFPDAVTGEKDAVNEDGSIKPQGIDTSFLVATLTAAIQELKAELDSVKAELTALKGA